MFKVSILMNCYNGERFLKEAIDSIYAQTYQDWEIIFIDNASTDKSSEIANSYDTRLRYYRIEQTIPLYAARNYGLQYISGQFIAFLDTDDIWMSDKLEKQIEVMRSNPSIYLTCTNFYRKNELLGSTSLFSKAHSKFLTFENTLDNYIISLSTVLLRVDVESAKKIIFESTLNLTGDYELFMKLIYIYNAYYIAKPLITARVHAKNLSAKLVNDWPKELSETHTRLEKQFTLTSSEKWHMDIRFAKTCSFVYLANREFRKARNISKKYRFKNLKLLFIYLSTFNAKLANWVVKARGF